MKYLFSKHFIRRGIAPLLIALFGIACSNVPEPIEVRTITFPKNNKVFPVDIKWRKTKHGMEMFTHNRTTNDILHYRNDSLLAAYDLDSILNYEGGSTDLLGFELDGNDLYLMPYEPANIIIKYNILKHKRNIYPLALDNPNVQILCYYNVSPMQFAGRYMIVPLSHNSYYYATNDSILFDKFSQPKSLVLNKKDMSVVGYLGAFDPRLRYEYFGKTFHFQTSMGKGIALSGFINDTICVYDEDFVLTHKISGKSAYYQPVAPLHKNAEDDSDFLHHYRMENFFYYNLKYSEPLNVLIRACLLPDVAKENGLLKSTLEKAFSLQFFKDGKLLKEVPFGNGQYHNGRFQVFEDKLIAFEKKEDITSTTWTYYIYNIADFL